MGYSDVLVDIVLEEGKEKSGDYSTEENGEAPAEKSFGLELLLVLHFFLF